MSSLAKGLTFSAQKYFSHDSVAAPPDALVKDISRYRNDGVFLGAGEPNWVRLLSGLWVMVFDGLNDIATIGNTQQPVQSFSCWIEANDITTRSIADFDAGTHSVEIDGASNITATGWAAPTIYVNGAVAAAITAAWKQIVVTTATAFAGSAVILGQEASFYDGKLGIPKIWNRALSASEILELFVGERSYFGV